MKYAVLVLILGAFAACKSQRSQPNRDSVPAVKTTPLNLEQWSGRSDFTENKWQIKSQP